MNLTLILMMVLPLLGGLGVWFFTRNSDAPWFAGPVTAVVGAVVVGVMFAAAYGGAVADIEIWSGKILSKDRVHGTYEESYSCNCSTDSKGNTSCQTCYRTHYTVDWVCGSSIGKLSIDSRDSTWRSVYSTPDPQRYTSINIGDPASKRSAYTNYVQAVPNSLFATSPKELAKRFTALLPPYPDTIFDIYRINRFLSPGFNFPDAAQWNTDISMMLRDLGPAKQVNVIVVIAKTTDPDYQFALRDHWEGVNKNDVVLVIGSEDGAKINFVSVLSWTKNELFKIQLADTVNDMGTIDRTKIIPAIGAQVAKNFERRHMSEFAYLKGEINPPTWLILITVLVLIAGYVVAAVRINKAFTYNKYWRRT